MGNCVGRMQGSVPPLLGDVIEPQLPSAVSSAPLSLSGRTRSHSALMNLAGIPPTRSWNDLPLEMQEAVATTLDLGIAKALRLKSLEFRGVGALRFRTAQIPTSLAEIGRMAEFFNKSRNIRALQIQDPANFTDEKLEKLVSMLGDRGPQIERLDLSDCHQLTNAGLAHLAGLTALQSLILSRCGGFTVLPNLDRLTALQELNLSHCGSLTVLPSLDRLTALQSLNLPDCGGLTVLPSLDRLTALQSLNLAYCRSLTVLPNLDHLTALQSLDLWNCHRLTALPNLDHLTVLQSLDLSDCADLTVLPNLGRLTALQSLDLSDCAGLTVLPNLNHLTALQSLNLSLCAGLTVLPNLDRLTVLQSLDLTRCPGVSDHLLAQLEQRGVNVQR